MQESADQMNPLIIDTQTSWQKKKADGPLSMLIEMLEPHRLLTVFASRISKTTRGFCPLINPYNILIQGLLQLLMHWLTDQSSSITSLQCP